MSIRLQNPYNQNELIIQPEGLFEDDSNKFPFVNGAYRLVKDDNYTENFGYQWNKFTTTQIDKTSQNNISYTRFFAETGWDKENLKDKNILEVGSGAGRFSQIVLDYTLGNLYSVDYSNAVQANYKNNGPSDRLTLFQASIYEMPFAKAQFDKVFCMGVLQHT
jgi:2-polyprenyl-3-methyl-5-hydroxy-6-metoxy-1,4-benzoquinol methylase